MRRDAYVLMEEYKYKGSDKDVELPSGAYVSPISPQYLPRHITGGRDFDLYTRPYYEYCYTRYGIIPIPFKMLRKV